MLNQTSEWNAHGFSRALEKNEVATLTKKRINTVCPVKIVETTLESKSTECKLGLKREKQISGWQCEFRP